MIHPTVNTRQTENGSDDSDESDDDSSDITIKLVDPVFDRFKKTMGDRYELETFGKALRRPSRPSKRFIVVPNTPKMFCL